MNRAASVASGGHSLTGDPVFVAPASDDYHLTPGSTAIDAGANAGVTTDIDGEIRPFGSGFDIGFDEWIGVLYRTFLPVARKD